jgi:hypothetical protein
MLPILCPIVCISAWFLNKLTAKRRLHSAEINYASEGVTLICSSNPPHLYLPEKSRQ